MTPTGLRFALADREYGFLDPYVVAEIGVNHEGDLDRAFAMIDSVAEAGGHAAKFQTYKAETLAAKGLSPSYWDRNEESSTSQFELFKKFDRFGPDEYARLAERCAARGVDFISTPFDLDSVGFIAALSPAMKIASADLTNTPLLRKVARTGKPVILSTGASRLDEIATALDTLRAAGAATIALLHCVLNYPTPPAAARLDQIDLLARVFGVDAAIGYSDHVKPAPDGAMPALVAAALRGATVLEKHFTDDKTASGNDHYHAMDGADLARFMAEMATYRTLYGAGPRDISGEAAAIANARRRVILKRAVAAGAPIGEEDLIALRSNQGVEVAHWDAIVGRRAARDLPEGAPLTWADLTAEGAAQ